MNLIELDRALKQLRLGGMAQVLEARLLQAQTERMAPIDILSTLVSDELTRRGDRLRARRVNAAEFRDPDRTLDAFDWDFNKKMNRALIFELAAGQFIHRHEDALFLGPPGTGKSHLAQAIGRWGNYFNQELFGWPTSLPWGLHVDEAFRPYGYATYEQFHPAFLYESLLNIGIFLALGFLWRPLHERFRPGCIVGAYLVLYGAVRVLMELVRIDPSNMVGPFRLNLIVAVLLLLTGVLVLLMSDRRRPQRL